MTDKTRSGVAHDSSRNTPSQFAIFTWIFQQSQLILVPSRLFVDTVTAALLPAAAGRPNLKAPLSPPLPRALHISTSLSFSNSYYFSLSR